MLTRAEKQRILKRHPESMSKEQFYKLCHISKSHARRLLEDGIIPCLIKTSATHKYVIATEDVISYLERRPYEYQRQDHSKQHESAPKLHAEVIPRELRDLLLPVIEEAFAPYPDVMTLSQVSEAIGYSDKSLVKWCRQGRIRNFIIKSYMIPKPWLIDFILSLDFINMRNVSSWHRKMIYPIIAAYLKKKKSVRQWRNLKFLDQ